MRILGLKGFTRSGRISHYFDMPDAIFPEKWNWRPSDVDYVIEYYRDRASDPYILTGFSDGGTLAHLVWQRDPMCLGAFIHAGLFPERQLNRMQLVDKPLLLTYVDGDLAPQVTARTKYAYEYYLDRGISADMLTIEPCPKLRWYGHYYGSCLDAAASWCLRRFGYVLRTSVKG